MIAMEMNQTAEVRRQFQVAIYSVDTFSDMHITTPFITIIGFLRLYLINNRNIEKNNDIKS